MLKLKWTSTTITDEPQAREIFKRIKQLPLEIGAFDTETSGLHIINDKPFIYQFGYICPDNKCGETFAVDLERHPALGRAVIKTWHKYAARLKKYLAHNTKFDLHMLINLGIPYETENLSDTMFYIRYAHDALTPKNGGPPLKLKEYATAYITPAAKLHEQALKKEQAMQAKALNLKLKARLIDCGRPPLKYKAKTYTIGVIEGLFKDCILEPQDLPEPIRSRYLEWYNNDIPEYVKNKMLKAIVESDNIPYYCLNRENLIRYAHYDIIFVLEIYLATKDVLRVRKNEGGLKFEEETILPILDMEREGFLADKPYLEESRIRLKNYIIERRKTLYMAAETEFKIGQHAFILSLLQNKYSLDIETTNADELDLLLSRLRTNKESGDVIAFIENLQELRTLEKWYSAYVIRFQNNLKFCDRLYTTINQVGTVSGRVTSDFQQFPSDPITDRQGNVLFHPRHIVKSETGLIYLDYSQIELRLQAFYTILVGHPDLNLCRAYMPYKCYANVADTKIMFDYTNPKHIRNYAKLTWCREEDGTMWTPTDVHGETTTKATGLTEKDEGFKHARKHIGKRTNFAKNYGAQYKKICTMFPDKTPEECRRIDNAYYEAFPGVKHYHEYCYRVANEHPYGENLFGVKYYGVSGHKLINLLMQGSAAYFLKLKIKEIHDFLKPYKSKIQMQIHDELSLKPNPADDPSIFFGIKQIMENWSDSLIPIVAEMEVTTTAWDEKKEVANLEDLRLHLGY